MSDVLAAILAAELGKSGGVPNQELMLPPDTAVGLATGTVARVMSNGKAASFPLGISGASYQGLQTIPNTNTAVNTYAGMSAGAMAYRRVDSGNTIVIYRALGGVNGALYARIADPDGNFGTPLVISGALAQNVSFYGGSSSYANSNVGLDEVIIRIDATRYLAYYRDNDTTPGVIKALILTVSGMTVSAGTTVVMGTVTNGSGGDQWTIAEMSPNSGRYVLIYANSTGRLLPFSVSGSTITLGTEKVLDTVTATGANIINVGVDRMIAVWSTSAGQYACVVTASGLTVTSNTKVLLSSTTSGSTFLYKVAPDKILMAGWGNPLTGFITASGTTVSYSASTNLGQAGYADMRLYKVVGNIHYFVRFATSGSILRATPVAVDGVAGTVTSGTVVMLTSTTAGAASWTFDASSNRAYLLAQVSGAICLVVYQLNVSTNVLEPIVTASGISNICQLSPTGNLTFGTGAEQLTTNNIGSLALLSSGKLLFTSLRNLSQSAGNIFYSSYLVVDADAFIDSAGTPSPSNSRIGVVQANGNVLLKGIADGFTGLVPSKDYYAHDVMGDIVTTTPAIATTAKYTLIGRAISPTQILMNDFIL